jgi:hypothetical protein
MYEEEDDDLPHHYRRLTANLQTGSVDFNRRLSAYLTNHVAMRAALDQAVRDSYVQQAAQGQHNPYLNLTGMGNPQMQGYPPHLLPNLNPQYMMPNLVAPMGMPGPAPAPASFPMPQPQHQTQPNFPPPPYQPFSRPSPQAHPHGRSASVVHSTHPHVKPEGRRMSMPVIKSESPPVPSIEPATPVSLPAMTPQSSHAHPEAANLEPVKNDAYLPQYTLGAFGGDFNPFAPVQPSLYPNPALDFPTDPLMTMFLAGSEGYGGAAFDGSYSGSLGKLAEKAEGIAPSQLDLGGLEYDPAVGEGLKGSVAGTPGVAKEGWNEWIDGEEWEGGVQ